MRPSNAAALLFHCHLAQLQKWQPEVIIDAESGILSIAYMP